MVTDLPRPAPPTQTLTPSAMEEDSLNSPSRFRDPHGILVIRDVRSILEHTEARSFVALDLGKLRGAISQRAVRID